MVKKTASSDSIMSSIKRRKISSRSSWARNDHHCLSSMESLSEVPSLYYGGGTATTICTKYPTQAERNILLERLETEVLRRFKIGKYKMKNKKKTATKVENEKCANHGDHQQSRTLNEATTTGSASSRSSQDTPKKKLKQSKELDGNGSNNGSCTSQIANAAGSRIVIGVNQVTRAMESAILPDLVGNYLDNDNKICSTTNENEMMQPTKKRQRTQTTTQEKKEKEQTSQSSRSTEEPKNLVPAVQTSPPPPRPQLLILARDVRPGHMLAHLISMAHHQYKPPIPILLLPGKTSSDLGYLLGIRTCSALLFVEQQRRGNQDENVVDNDVTKKKLLEVCHKDIDYFIDYAKSKIPT